MPGEESHPGARAERPIGRRWGRPGATKTERPAKGLARLFANRRRVALIVGLISVISIVASRANRSSDTGRTFSWTGSLFPQNATMEAHVDVLLTWYYVNPFQAYPVAFRGAEAVCYYVPERGSEGSAPYSPCG